MITEITEINVTTETTIEEITEVTTTEDPIIIMTEMIEMTDNITEEEGEEMTMIMTTMMIEKNTEDTEITSEEIIKTEMTDQRDLTNLSMMIIRKMSKKKRKIKHHN